jgi:uncharacterized membrane protein
MLAVVVAVTQEVALLGLVEQVVVAMVGFLGRLLRQERQILVAVAVAVEQRPLPQLLEDSVALVVLELFF